MILLRYRRFYLSCLAAFTAGHMINYSVILYAQEVIGSDLLSGVGFGLCFGPPLLLGWYAGVLCDRLAPARLIHAAQALFLLATLLLLWADQGGSAVALRTPLLLAAALLAGVGWSFVAPARMAALGQIASADDMKPAAVAFNLLVMLGFGLAPLAIALARRSFGWPGVFSLAALLWLLASLWLMSVPMAGLRPDRPPRGSSKAKQHSLKGVPKRRRGRAHRPLAAEIGAGLAAVRSRPLLLQLMVAALAGYLALGPMTVLLPKLAATQLGLSELQRGSFLGTLALALIAGGVVALIAGRPLHHGRTIFAATALAGAALAALGAAHGAAVATMLLCVVGVAGGLALSLIVAGIQANAPEAVRGRIVSQYTIISQVVPAASGVAAGAMAQAFGVAIALHVSGATLVIAMLGNVLWMAALRRYRG